MLNGVYTALVTPFNADGSLDEEALRELVDFQIAGGVAGIVPVGTTGESPTVTHDENIRIVEIVADQTRGRAAVIAGTGSNSTAEAVRMTRLAADVGATATLQVAPYYNTPTQEGLYRHFIEVAESSRLPVVIYNIPGRTSVSVDPATTLRLAAHANVTAVKEASGSMAVAMEIIAGAPAEFAVVSGDDNLTLPLMSLGAKGVISVASNIAPKQMVELVGLAAAGRFEDARKLHYRLLPLFRAIFVQTNPIPIKYALARRKMIVESYRLPLCPLSDSDRAIVDRAIDQVMPE